MTCNDVTMSFKGRVTVTLILFYTNVQNVLQDQQVIKEKETQFVCD